MKNLNQILRLVIFLSLLPYSLSSCGKSLSRIETEDSNIELILPLSIEIVKGGGYTFSVSNNTLPSTSDVFILEGDNGVSYSCPIIGVSGNGFTVQIHGKVVSGNYKASIRHNDRKRSYGSLYVKIVAALDITLAEGTTVYGTVLHSGEPVKGVVVSDGYEVAVTDGNGVYQLKSDKKRGYVFISLPSGYEAETEGVIPVIYKRTYSDKSKAERLDFNLKKAENTDNYKVMFWGDMHLANRTNDMGQFSRFVDEVNDYVSNHKETKVYAITLGDMTWDIYWNNNKFGLEEYVRILNSRFHDIQVFHTMGNHDNDFAAHSDWEAEKLYCNMVSPSYYSFNLGQIHYVVLDDIDCDGYDGTTARKYKERVLSEQLGWLRKDLSFIDKSVPVIIAMHAPLYKPVKSESDFTYKIETTNAEELLGILDGYNVRFVTGHSHLMFNVTPQSAVTGGRPVYEHNSGAVCGSWWWSGYLTEGVHLSPDGTPGGYSIWDIKGKEISRLYKATGRPATYQFRTYDLNQVSFSLDDVPDMPKDIDEKVRNEYLQYVKSYPKNENNEVLINIWNWNPSWRVSVTTENGKQLPVSQVWAFDPLHIAALSVKRFNSSSLKSIPNFITEEYTHFFKIKAPDKNTGLRISVSDESGNTWTEDMKRPKLFSIENYK